MSGQVGGVVTSFCLGNSREFVRGENPVTQITNQIDQSVDKIEFTPFVKDALCAQCWYELFGNKLVTM